MTHFCSRVYRWLLLVEDKEENKLYMSRPASSSSLALPMENTKHSVDQLFAVPEPISTGINLDHAFHQVRMSEVDALLQDTFPDVSAQQLLHFRKLWPRSSSITVRECLDACSKYYFPKKRPSAKRRKTTHIQQAQNLGNYEHTLTHLPILTENEGLECQICFENRRPEDTLHCRVTESHTVCRACFYRYCKENVGITHRNLIKCIMCSGMYDPLVVEINLPEVFLTTMEAKQRAQDYKVATQGRVAATLYCECGTVGIIEESDVGNNMVTCTCGRTYCILCGNYAHQGTLCPAPREVLKWINAHAKQCPNCGVVIQKNGGCNHMTCRPPGGCRHEFCWVCLGPWNRCRCR